MSLCHQSAQGSRSEVEGEESTTAKADAPKGEGRKRKPVDKSAEAKQPKQRKSKPTSEKRLGPDGRTVRWVPAPSMKLADRIARARPGSGHRMYLIDRTIVQPVGEVGGGLEKFDVLGVTSNVYCVTVSRHPNCTCPDFQRHKAPCKHIIFVLLRVLKVDSRNPLLWQKAFLSHEVDTILQNGVRNTVDLDAIASSSVKTALDEIRKSGDPDLFKSQPEPPSITKDLEGKECAICQDDFKESESDVISCRKCHNHLHRTCFDRWVSTKSRSGGQVTCVYCRTKWPKSDFKDTPKSDKYINLASVAGQTAPPTFDTLYSEESLRFGGFFRR